MFGGVSSFWNLTRRMGCKNVTDFSVAILSNNQAQENGKILNGAYVKEPSDSQIKMLRYAMRTKNPLRALA